MKKIMLMFLVAAFVVTPFVLAEEGMAPADMPMGPTVGMYQCPMDGYVSEKAGKCPKCGMDLVEQQMTPEEVLVAETAQHQEGI